ncbi:RHS repeat domain-containing protein [Phocoenobacter atlanticus]|uniref:RHS repeat domain-containing protein n=1 Tax=Phocoenobacter atlanticus TaxID=3416742 RepID=UPI00275B38F2|nr:RHS repeat-associated core domain-containing protein [Pasteurella atlantica]MDP8100372.1 RHS repeat-associated core domain-containing protein [Pasteurella atlantica]
MAGQALSRHYQYDALDRLISIDDSLRGKTDYRYNGAGQVVELHHTGADGKHSRLFGYDSELNLNSIKANPPVDGVLGLAEQKTLAYDNAGRVINTDQQAFSYDDCGRLQAKTTQKKGFRPQKTAYHWDDYDRLIGVTLPDGERWYYEYDPFGRRIGKTRVDSQEQHRYFWEGDNLISHEVLNDDTRVSLTEWVYEPDSFRPLAQINTDADNVSQLSYIITDHAGTASELCNENGEIIWQGQQALWGEFSEKSASDISCDLRYQGQIHDRETGLYYNRYRYYDTDSCQYLSSDPIGLAGGIRPQAYVADPVGAIDPLGLTEHTFEETGEGTDLRRTTEIEGGTKVRINSGHSYSRAHKGGDVRDSGLSMNEIDNAIVNDISNNVNEIKTIPKITERTIDIDGYKLTYRAGKSSSGDIMVATYFPGK